MISAQYFQCANIELMIKKRKIEPGKNRASTEALCFAQLRFHSQDVYHSSGQFVIIIIIIIINIEKTYLATAYGRSEKQQQQNDWQSQDPFFWPIFCI